MKPVTIERFAELLRLSPHSTGTTKYVQLYDKDKKVYNVQYYAINISGDPIGYTINGAYAAPLSKLYEHKPQNLYEIIIKECLDILNEYNGELSYAGVRAIIQKYKSYLETIYPEE
jgi:hypothetical protein